jgi:hypothetical protein
VPKAATAAGENRMEGEKKTKSLTEKLTEGLEKYGVIAAVTWFALFFLSWGLFFVFLKSGVDVESIMKRMGFEVVRHALLLLLLCCCCCHCCCA